MTIHTNQSKFISYGILFWLLLMIFGPYVPFMGTFLRLDHFLFPTVGTGIFIFFSFKNRKIIIPKVLYYFFGFLFIAFVGTLIAVSKEEFHIRLVPFIAGLDNHLRIVLIFLLVGIFVEREEIDSMLIIKGLLFSTVFLSLFGYFQVSIVPRCIYDFTEKISINWYSGRSDRGINMPYLLRQIRAISTFYLPGNFAIFTSMMLSFLIIPKDKLKLLKSVYYILLFFIVLGLYFTASKGFFMGIGIVSIYLAVTKKWMRIIELSLMIFLVFLLSTYYGKAPTKYYSAFIKADSISALFNRALGERFGKINQNAIKCKKILKRQENNENQKIKKEINFKSNIKSDQVKIIKHIEINKNLNQSVSMENNKRLQKQKFIFEKGNLSKSLKVVAKNIWYGVGYVSNVDYGDSMVVHLLVRGGILGVLLFVVFIIKLCVVIYKKNILNENLQSLSAAWIVTCMVFFVSGIAYPTFIQDRSADVFWWLGAILALSSKKYDNI